MVRPTTGHSSHPQGSFDESAKGLKGEDLVTFRTLQAHDKLKGTECASAYKALIDAAKTQYDDDMRVASLLSSAKKGFMPSERKTAQLAAAAKRTAAKAAAVKFGIDCMQGKVPSGQETDVVADVAKGINLVVGSKILPDAVIAQVQAEKAARQAQAAEAEIIDGADVIQQQQQMMQQQAAMDAALAAEEEGEKNKRLLLYAVLGLGAAGAAYFFISRRKA
jgi:hypothetical protein